MTFKHINCTNIQLEILKYKNKIKNGELKRKDLVYYSALCKNTTIFNEMNVKTKINKKINYQNNTLLNLDTELEKYKKKIKDGNITRKEFSVFVLLIRKKKSEQNK